MSVLSFKYENFENIINLVYEITDKSLIDSVEHGMITSNTINGLLKLSYSSLDDRFYYKYNISSKISLSRYLESEITKKKLLNILSNIMNTLLEIEDYMILKEHVILDKQYIFIDVSTSDAFLVCLPMKREDSNYDIRAFIKNLLFNARFEQSENTNYISVLINALNKDEVFNLKNFLDVINKLKTNSSKSLLHNNDSNYKLDPNLAAEKRIADKVPESQKSQNNKIVENIIVSNNSTIQSSSKNESQDIKLNDEIDKKNSHRIENKLEDKLGNLISLFHKDEDKEKEKENKKGTGKNEKNSRQKDKSKKENKFGFAIPGMESNLDNDISVEKSNKPQKENKSNIDNENKPKGLFNLDFINLDKKEKKSKDKEKNKSDDNIQIQSILPDDISIRKSSDVLTEITNSSPLSDDTCLLVDVNSKIQKRASLIRKINNEQVYITKDLFKIGKEPSYVDYIILDNNTISRTHADILRDGNDYYIQDNNSKNHTYVNNILVQSGERVKLDNNTVIKLSNEEFIFRLS